MDSFVMPKLPGYELSRIANLEDISRGDRRKKLIGPIEFHNTEQLMSLGIALNKMRTAGTFTDITLVCDDGEVSAHKLILNASCQYFTAMFRTELTKLNPGRVQFPGISVKIMDIVLEFLYSGANHFLENNMSIVKQVLCAAHMMQLQILVDCTIANISLHLSPDNFAEFWELSDRFSLSTLNNKVFDYIGNNFNKLDYSGVFNDLTASQLEELLLAFGARQKPDNLALVIIKWVKCNFKYRESHLTTLFDYVNLSLLTNKFLHQLTEDPTIKQSLTLLHMMFTAATSRLMYKEISVPSLPYRIHFLKLTGDGVTKIQTYYTRERAWSMGHDITNTNISFACICSLASYIYFLDDDNNTLVRYHPDSGHCLMHTLPANMVSNSQTSIFSFRNSILLINETEFWEFDTIKLRWSRRITLKWAERKAFFAVTDEAIFACDNTTSTINQYDCENDSWKLATRNPDTLNNEFAVSKNKLFFFKQAVLNVFDPISDQWEKIDFPGAEDRSMVTLHSELPFLLFFEDHNCNHLWLYEPVSDKWEQLAKRMEYFCWNKCLVTLESNYVHF